MFKFGEIIHVDHFPYSDKKDFKNRYAVIVSNGELLDGDYVLAQITTTLRGDEYSILLDKAHILKPLKKESEIRVHKLWTGNKKIMSKYPYGQLTAKGEIKLRGMLAELIKE